MQRVRTVILLVLATLSFSTVASCKEVSPQEVQMHSCYDANAAVDYATRYLSQHDPEFGSIKLTPNAHDLGDEWVVIFNPPQGTVGGSATVNVQKSPCRVVGAILGQ